MPIYNRKDIKGSYFQYGKTGHKYYYTSNKKSSIIKAYNLCLRQVMAIHSSQRKYLTN